MKYEATIKLKLTQLGVQDRQDYENLKTDKFLQLRMNARALKMRIRQRLRERKFELERLERTYRNAVNGKYNTYIDIVANTSTECTQTRTYPINCNLRSSVESPQF